VTCAKELSKREKENYIEYVESRKNEWKKDASWTAALMKIIAYKEPHLALANNIKYLETSMLHIAANFVGSGR
jgi:hypothetical protein